MTSLSGVFHSEQPDLNFDLLEMYLLISARSCIISVSVCFCDRNLKNNLIIILIKLRTFQVMISDYWACCIDRTSNCLMRITYMQRVIAQHVKIV